MTKRTKLADRHMPSYTKGEEIFNMVSHIVGGALGIVAIVLCSVFAGIERNVYGVVSGAIFGVTMLLLYTASSIYHGLKPNTMAKRVFQVIDHCMIFILIAGTYTPIALCTMRERNVAESQMDVIQKICSKVQSQVPICSSFLYLMGLMQCYLLQ